MRANRIIVVQVGRATGIEFTESLKCTSLEGAHKILAKRRSAVYAEYKEKGTDKVTKFKHI